MTTAAPAGAARLTGTTPRRILVIGSSCAGKTTFARRLAALLQTPVIELDELHWGENWQAQPDEQFARQVRQSVRPPTWIADGNYSSVRDILWPRATDVVWLNYRFPCVFWRGLKRSLRRSLTRETLWHGNRESFQRTFLSRDSILLWIISTHGRRRREFSELRRSAAYPHLEWIEFTSPDQTEHWLCELAAGHRDCPARCVNSG